MIAEANLHPFRFGGASVALAHNGHLREFARMRYDLISHVRPELAQKIEGTTDSEWIYALVLSQLADPFGVPGAGRAGRRRRVHAARSSARCAAATGSTRRRR